MTYRQLNRHCTGAGSVIGFSTSFPISSYRPITRDDEEAFSVARFRGWNHDLNIRANPLGFVIASGVRDVVTTYINNAMPANENEMRRVFTEETMKRLWALKKKHDPEGMFRTGAWQYEANT